MLGGEPRRGHSSALGARRSALGARRSALGARRSALGARRSALLVMQPTRLPNTVERIAKSPGKLWGEPSPPARSEPFSETPAHRGPDHDLTSMERCAVARNRFFLRGGSVFLRHIPARYFMHNPTRPGNRAAPLHRHRRPQRRCPRSRPPWAGACVTLWIWCRPLRRAAIRTRFPTRCRFGQRLTATHVARSLAQYY